MAEFLIRRYFQSWLQQDLSLCLEVLSPSVKVEESHGPVYHGVDEVRRWFLEWHSGSGQGKVTRWDIFSILYDEIQVTAAVEWDFECVYAGNTASFLGASLVHFEGTKISRIQEYKMEKS
jgi:hypothetical protein